jgi:hypothetical protein
MKHAAFLIPFLVIAACGGGKKPTPAQPKEEATEASEPPAEEKAAEPTPEAKPEEPAEPAPPPPPKMWKAKADLAPVKGQKFKPAAITFEQEEGGATKVASEGFEGLKAGTYHLVVHEAADCGKNATKVGKAFAGQTEDLTFKIEKKGPATIAVDEAKVSVGGDTAITGHTLVLTDDKKGKPNKALACGPIAVLDGD